VAEHVAIDLQQVSAVDVQPGELPATMAAWVIREERFGEPKDAFQIEEIDVPEPAAFEVIVRVMAAGVNYNNVWAALGKPVSVMKYGDHPQFGHHIGGSDASGIVWKVGAGVTRWKPGDRVMGIFMQNWLDGPPTPVKVKGALGGDIDGMLAEQVVLNEMGLVRMPRHLSFEEAATLPCAGVTAWNALAAADVKPGSTVLIQGTGGVSIFALQFARLRGARVLGVSSSDEKLDRATAMGLDAGLNYSENLDWDRWAMDETGGEGVDVVVEVGGQGTLARSLRAVRMGGVVAQIGVLTASAEPLNVPTILHKQARIQGIYVGSRKDFVDMLKAIALNRLRPVGENFHWSQTREVLGRMEEASHFGKLVVTVD
jgi:NADPH:quinone reductase-like Zn-dependent oxidoreductase